MEINDIISGLNSCDDSCSNTDTSSNCCCDGSFGPNPGFVGNCGGFGNGFGNCGLNSWIWILLILFYCGCGKGGFRGNYGGGCCCEEKHEHHDCCCGGGNSRGLGNCGSYLFLLVILFLCNGRLGGGCAGNIGGFNGCCTNNFSC